MLKGLTLTEFKEKFPQVSTYGLEDPLNVYRQLDEDDYEIIGYIED